MGFAKVVAMPALLVAMLAQSVAMLAQSMGEMPYANRFPRGLRDRSHTPAVYATAATLPRSTRPRPLVYATAATGLRDRGHWSTRPRPRIER